MTDNTNVHKSKTKKVYKHNKLNKANFANYNLNDYRVYLNTIALIGGVDAQGKYLQPNELTRKYTLSAKEFSEQFNVDIKNSYRILKDAVDKLMKTDIKLEQPELFKTTRINVCEQAEYNHRDGTITVEFTQRIMEYLKQRTKNFTLYNLKEVAELTSIYSVRLYELVQQFNTTTGMIIHTIEQWRDIFGISQEQYKTYNNLKQKVFNQALEEINLKTGYQLVMTEGKEGRKVVRVRFDFKPDLVHQGMDVRTGEIATRHRKPSKPKQPIKSQSDQQQLFAEASEPIKPEEAKAKINAKLSDPANKDKFIKHEKGVPVFSKETAKRAVHNFKAQTVGASQIIDALASIKAETLNLLELLEPNAKKTFTDLLAKKILKKRYKFCKIL